MVKKNSYTDLGELLSAETAFIQAAHALDVAGHIAEENRDVDSLLNIAQTYVAIAERLMPHHHDEEEEEEGYVDDFGFQPSAVSDTIYEPEEPELELEDEDDNED